MLRRVALVRTNDSKELTASFIRLTRIDELGTTQQRTLRRNTKWFLRSLRRLLITACVAPSSLILVTPMKEAVSCSESSVLTRATRRNIPEDTVLPWFSFNGSKDQLSDNMSVACLHALPKLSRKRHWTWENACLESSYYERLKGENEVPTTYTLLSGRFWLGVYLVWLQTWRLKTEMSHRWIAKVIPENLQDLSGDVFICL
jgi:hypothetical protein